MDQNRHGLAQPLLYRLHAAYLALLSAPSTSKNPCPLPLWGSIQARSFLAELAQEDDRSDMQSKGRSAVPSASTLSKGLNALPTHWIQHNSLCGQCGSVCIPGISSTMPRNVKGKGKNASETFACMVCLDASGEGSKQNRMPTLDEAAKEASKARFPSVRKRNRSIQGKGRIIEDQEQEATASSRAAGLDQNGTASHIVTKSEKPTTASAQPASLAVGPDTSKTLKRKVSTMDEPEIQDPKSLLSGSKTPQEEKDWKPKKVAAAPATRPPAPASQLSAAGKSKSSSAGIAKQDHRAALRSLLMKDAKKKGSDASKKDADKHRSSAGGGGLRDFLADM